MSEKPESSEFWDTRYRQGRTPWDAAGVPRALERYLRARPGSGRKVLIPGCGSGYEVAAFAEAGYGVTALDFSPAAVAKARTILPPELGEHVIEGDFFNHVFAAAPFDLIYERTFFCALPPEMWPRIVERSASLLKPGGFLVGVYFFGGKEEGPPFGLAPGEVEHLFGPRFDVIADTAIPREESRPIFAGAERWQEWRRKQ